MRKFTMMVLLLLCVLSISGCKKDGDAITGVSDNESTSDEVQANVDGEATTVVDESNSQENSSIDDYRNAVGTPVTDASVISDLGIFLDNFYFNFLFNPASETGEISEMDMQLFAISYIYQYENTDLRFDADKFVLYIPDEKVSDVIKRFFNVDFVNHGYPLNAEIAYEDGYYLMPAKDENFGPAPLIQAVLKISDTLHRIRFEEIIDASQPAQQMEAIVEAVNGRNILKNYWKVVVAEPEADTVEVTTQAVETTTEASSND